MDHYNEFLDRLGMPGAFRRNHYYYGRLLDEDAFLKEQAYHIRKRWLLNRLSQGYGVLAGLRVRAKNGQVCILPGAALDSFGREIVVPQEVCLDPWQITGSDGKPGERLDPGLDHRVAICVAYRECAADFVPVMIDECGAEEECAPNSILEGFKVFVLRADALPPVETPGPEMCAALVGGAALAGGGAADRTTEERKQELCRLLDTKFPETAEAGCVWLAEVTLQPGPRIGNIDSCARRAVIYSNAELFEMILCLADRLEECCNQQPTTEPPTTEPPTTEPPTTEPPTTEPPTTQPPTTEPPTTEPPTTEPPTTEPPTTEPPTTPPPGDPLRLLEMEFINRAGITVGGASSDNVLGNSVLSLPRDEITTIRFQFSKAVDPSSFRVATTSGNQNRANFVLLAQGRQTPLSGQIIPEQDPRRVRFVLRRPAALLIKTNHRLELYGNSNMARNAILSQAGDRFDGEPLGLPSGDGVEGGDFVLQFNVQ
jgi:hypothetical protein